MSIEKEAKQVSTEIEHSVITLENKTTGDKIIYDLKAHENGRIDVSIDYDPKVGDQDQYSLMGNCAMALLKYLGSS